MTTTGFARRARTENTLLVRMNRMNAGDVARVGYQALMKGKATVVPGWFNKLMIGVDPLFAPVRKLKNGQNADASVTTDFVIFRLALHRRFSSCTNPKSDNCRFSTPPCLSITTL